MTAGPRRGGAVLTLCAACVMPGGIAAAQTIALPEIVVTPYYSPTPLSRTGASVTVISGERLARSGPGSLAHVLRQTAGVSVIESGGPGATSEIRIRGAETGHTLVLIDGVRVNDSATARDDFDFSLIAPEDIDRIEILRGPQSAIYGSDAMGGVVNIVTKKASKKKIATTASAEIGSYGSRAASGSVSMSEGDFSLRFGGSHYFTNGFSRRGSRDGNEPDSYEKLAGNIRATYDPKSGLGFDFGLTGSQVHSDYDAAGSNVAAPDAANTVDKRQLSGFLTFMLPGAGFDQSLKLFAAASDRHNVERAPPTPSIPDSYFRSRSTGAEYRGTIDLDALGTLLIGGRIEHETAENYAPGGGFSGYSREKTSYAVFAEQKITLGERFHLAFSGRYDASTRDDEGRFTWRATGVYEIPETETRFKGSVATGVKLPTAYMLANNAYQALTYPDQVELTLKPEESLGFDVGIEQALLDGRVQLSATSFYNRFRNLHGTTSLSSNIFDVAYGNISRARTSGVELSADADVIPEVLTVGGTYTYLHTEDTNGKPLARRPQHSGSVNVTWTPTEEAEATLAAVYVGKRYNSSGGSGLLAAYWRADLTASYALSPQTTVFGRIENLFDATYQDPSGFNTPGRSYFVGLKWKS